MLGRTPRETGRVVEEAARQVSVASEGVRLKTGGGSLAGSSGVLSPVEGLRSSCQAPRPLLSPHTAHLSLRVGDGTGRQMGPGGRQTARAVGPACPADV